MSEPSTAAVNHDTDLSDLFNSHLACTELIVNLIDHLYLSVVVASTQRAQLRARFITQYVCNTVMLTTSHKSELQQATELCKTPNKMWMTLYNMDTLCLDIDMSKPSKHMILL